LTLCAVAVGVIVSAFAQDEGLEDRLPNRPFTSEKPMTLLDMWLAVTDSFDIPIALEPLPEHCLDADTPEELLPPIEIAADETFATAISRLESASGHRWKFEQIRGTPVLRPNVEVLGRGNALDTVIDLRVEDVSVWDSLCTLARAVNRQKHGDNRARKQLHIWPDATGVLRRPAPIFMKPSIVTLDLESVTARRALCAIFETAEQRFSYSYHCGPDRDYMNIIAYDKSGSVVHGGRMLDKKEWQYWTDANILKLQS
jgi:hypothetical protein